MFSNVTISHKREQSYGKNVHIFIAAIVGRESIAGLVRTKMRTKKESETKEQK